MIRGALDRVPITGRGLLLGAVSALAVSRLGYGALDLVALTIGLAGLALLLVSGLASASLAWWLRRGLRERPSSDAPARCETDAPFETDFELSLPAWLPFVAVEWHWEEPPQSECRTLMREGRLRERVRIAARCDLPHVERKFVVRDVFSLWRIAWRRSEATPIRCLPNLGALRRIGVVHSLSSGEEMPHPAGELVGDRLEIRRYAPGDPVRHILWKAFARTRDLYVRTPERSLADARRTLAYLVTDAEDEAAAAALRMTLQSGALGDDWAVGADGVDAVAEELGAALALIARSGNVAAREQGRAAGLEAFLRESARGNTRCVVFAPASSGAWLETALAALARWPGTRFVLAADGVARREPVPVWQRVLYDEPPVRGVDANALSASVGRIVSAGHAAVFVDRSTGQVSGTERTLPMQRSA